MPVARIQMPDGRIARVQVPDGTTPEQAVAMARQVVAQQQPQRSTSALGGFLAGVLKPLDNLTNAAMHIPGMAAIDRAGQWLGLPSEQSASDGNAAYRANNTRKGFQMFGNIAGTAPTMMLPGGPLVQGAAGGALLSDSHTLGGIAKDAAIGGVAGKVGQQVGKRLFAPIAERLGNTAIAKTAAGGLSNAIQQATGRDMSAFLSPGMAGADRSIARMVPAGMDNVRQNLTDAARLKLPYALADADPRLQALGGSVARSSPDAMALAEQTFQPRALGQADRAVAAIDQHLAPVTDIEARAAQIRQAASNAAQPHYDAAYARPAPLDEELNGMLGTPAGKAALGNAVKIAQNRGIDPAALGFGIDGSGNLMIAKTPTMQTLDLAKQGLDTHLNSSRNPITGRLDLEGDRVSQSVNDLLSRYKAKLDALSPDYAQARSVYAENIQPRTALRLGHDVLPNGSVPQRQFDTVLAAATPETLPELQRGYATAMADQANKMRLSRNPYDAVYGSTDQQAKIASLFPHGAADFGRSAQLEGDMGRTAYQTISGSKTQASNMADQNFASDLAGPAIDLAHGVATGGKSLAIKGLGVIGKRADKSLTESRASTLAPYLFNADPNAALGFLDDLAKRQAVRGLGSRLLSVPFTAGALSLTNGPQ